MAADTSLLEWALAKVDASGEREVFHVRVGAPQYLEAPFPAWRCVFTVEDHFERETTVVGATALQALGLALRVVRTILREIATEAALIEVETGQPLDQETLAEAVH